MLVVQLHFHPRRTGVTRHVESVVPALAARVETRVLGNTVDPALPRIGWGELMDRARREPVVVHAHRNNELLAALSLRTLRPNVRVVFTRHSATRPSRYTRWLAARADARISLTAAMARIFDPTSRVIPHGVELARLAPPADRTAALEALVRTSALAPGGTLAVGVIGRVRRQKGQGDFAAAVAPLLEADPRWRALVVGRVQPEDAGWARQAVLGTPRLELLPERSDIEAVYRALTVCVQPSHSEGFSLVLLEAMAAGCCVVAARLPHYPELIDDGRTGLLYPPGDVAALRELLRGLLADPARAQALGAAAAEEARARFGVETEAQALIQLYRSVTGPSRSQLPGSS